VAVAQLLKWLLRKAEDCGLNPVMGKIQKLFSNWNNYNG